MPSRFSWKSWERSLPRTVRILLTWAVDLLRRGTDFCEIILSFFQMKNVFTMGKSAIFFACVNCPRVKNKLFHFTIDNIFSALLIGQHGTKIYSAYLTKSIHENTSLFEFLAIKRDLMLDFQNSIFLKKNWFETFSALEWAFFYKNVFFLTFMP